MASHNFYKAINSARELLRNDQFEGLNGQLLLKLTEIFLQKYTMEAGLTRAEADRHKARLFEFYKDFTNCINDYKVWRLLSRVKNELGESFTEVKSCKMNEIRSLQKINW